MKILRKGIFLLLLSVLCFGWQSPALAQSADDILQQHTPETNTVTSTSTSSNTSTSATVAAGGSQAKSSEDARFEKLFDSLLERLLKIFERLTGILDTLSKNVKKATTNASTKKTTTSASADKKPATSSAGPLAQKINDIALTFPKRYDGYKKFPYAAGTEGGNLGCANVVSAALKEAGVKAWSLSVSGVKSQLLALKAPNNWKIVNPPPYAPGDVVCWSAPSGSIHGHIGIVVKNGNTFSAMNNSSSKRKPILSTPVNYRAIACVLRKA